ncbi:PKD domain-containing protein [Paenibacillus antri]|uniref:PKD domain-containing protein n=1 Tax=Paenibacillus antri TaxID=2582848 RepID=A0A5R9G672_9BACL|nr:discoidin domain-containing protein [Paenibacillus antri]TLS51877.1 PKD domain-containing protein [Paenibacillus antri]
MTRKNYGTWVGRGVRTALAVAIGCSIAVAAVPARVGYAATYDVTAYGANGSDTSDDRSAIQNAIDSASSGDAVYVPNGTYFINGPLTMKSGVKLTGQGQSTAIVKSSGTGNDYMVKIFNANNVVVSNLMLDGNNVATTMGGIAGYAGSGHHIHHVTVKNIGWTGASFGGFGIRFFGDNDYTDGVTDSVIENNTFANLGVASIWGGGVRLSWGSSRNRVSNNTISNTGRGGIFVDNGSTDNVIKNNTISGSGLTAEKLGIEIWEHSDRALIEDNVVDHWISLDSSPGSAVRRNTVGSNAATVGKYGLENVASSYSILTDNVVDGNQEMGVTVSNADPKDYIYWGYNTIDGMTLYGAQIQGSTGGAKGHYFFKNKFLNTADSTGSAGFGFRINGNVTYLTLLQNEIKNNASHGINVTGAAGVDQLSVVGNTITGNGGRSIDQYPAAAADLEWSGNTVSGNGTNTQLTSRGFANTKPTANFTSATTVTAGTPVSFTNTSTDPGGSIAVSLWDFNDGLPSTSANPTHTFANPGTYRVTLVVWDNLGRASHIEKTITVTTGSSSTNVALNRTVTATASCANSESPPKAVDGLTTTKWCDGTAGDKKLAVDLGSSYSIHRWVVKHAGAGGEGTYYNTRDFKLQKSADGVAWTDVDSVTGNTANVTDRNVTPFTTRYVRLYITYPSTIDSTARIYELEVYSGGGGGGDATAPTAPTNLSSPSKTTTSVSLTWTASTDNVAVVGYDIYRNGVLCGSSTTTSYTCGNLTPNTAYSFTVKARDAVPNVSAASSALSVTTLASTNVALNKTVTATASCASSETGPKAVDGLLTTKWCDDTAGDKKLTVDLGSNHTITRWVVKHAAAGGEGVHYNTKDFKLQRSSDGVAWTDVDSVTGNTANVTDRNVTPFTSRYVRLYITAPSQSFSTAARIYEFEVYN